MRPSRRVRKPSCRRKRMSNLLRRRRFFLRTTLIHDGRRINTSPTPPSATTCRAPPGPDQELHDMHCGYLLCMFLPLWAELVASRALLTTRTPGGDMQSIIEDLEAALKDYSRILRGTVLGQLEDMPCMETAAQLSQSSVVFQRLSLYRTCVEPLLVFPAATTAFCQVIRLNEDLLINLNSSYQDSAPCPSSLTSSLTDSVTLSRSLQCVDCWSLQVTALRS